ncbi:uncharacterized protein PHACADRAFT_93367 [Phanerochaete carnosa HHB-10118-sp]|uniref:Deoxyuridine 5'-triphosphate nucleotidohydrolase n=1 Tax=Phanerochaete carnosa (strain HHB-10118-sp) TaxID=650164 RepID=K5WBP8_PHACS|nr:uncharacterized protein PHACADRAFT_93367 [Phanerochaete carnosa HHB-10118-sp]EKM56394.1 hypothetical protein PHACADRAFT_93367 [Phanerochaete carnosa HHB-10118-sp]
MTIRIPPLLTRPVHILTHDTTLLVQRMGGILPKQGTEESAGFDLYSAESVQIPARDRKIVGTGIAIRAPHGTYAQIAPRSGLAVKGIDVGAGVVDQDYTGEVRIVLINSTSQSFQVRAGNRIAQVILERIASCNIEEVSSLSSLMETQRGSGGFGSTGK